MPRPPRLDIPDLVHHVIVRGIKRDKIFRDDDDRRNFMQRFHALRTETDTICYAWALSPNHCHLLLRPRRVALSSFMRQLLTGYAVTHNKRHNRMRTLVSEPLQVNYLRRGYLLTGTNSLYPPQPTEGAPYARQPAGC